MDISGTSSCAMLDAFYEMYKLIIVVAGAPRLSTQLLPHPRSWASSAQFLGRCIMARSICMMSDAQIALSTQWTSVLSSAL